MIGARQPSAVQGGHARIQENTLSFLSKEEGFFVFLFGFTYIYIYVLM